jgi:hypothetical protein
MRSLLFLTLTVTLFTTVALAETPVETSNETRFQLDFKVPDAALAAFLPSGSRRTSRPPAPQKTAISGLSSSIA